MATSEPNTELLLIMGQKALDFARDSLTDPWRLAQVFGGAASYDPDAHCITAPPMHELFPGAIGMDKSKEFIEALQKTGFTVFCSLDATYIEWPNTPAFLPVKVEYRTAKAAADYALDHKIPVIDECLKRVMDVIEKKCETYAFSLTTNILLNYPETIYVEVIIYLQNSGYTVKKAFAPTFEPFESDFIGHTISWYPAKVVRDMRVVPWWERLWKKWRNK